MDNIFNIMAVLIVLSALMTFPGSSSILSFFNLFLKLTYIVYIYYFLRVFIQTRTDFIGVLTTMLYASIFPLFNLLYEVFVSPVSANTDRMQGLFADVINYASYLIFSMIIIVYFYFQRRKLSTIMKINPTYIIIYFGIVLMGMWQIKHMASIAVFLMVLGLFLIHDMRKRTMQIILYSILIIVTFIVYGDAFLEEVINPRMMREVEVVKGERKTSQAFHGRMSRWEGVWSRYKSASLFGKVFGYPYEFDRKVNAMVGFNVHNDYLRMLFFTGIIGLLVYLFYIYKLVSRIKYLNKSDKFVSVALLASLFLYSITTIPTIYVGFMNVYVSLFAYLALPQRVLLKYKND